MCVLRKMSMNGENLSSKYFCSPALFRRSTACAATEKTVSFHHHHPMFMPNALLRSIKANMDELMLYRDMKRSGNGSGAGYETRWGTDWLTTWWERGRWYMIKDKPKISCWQVTVKKGMEGTLDSDVWSHQMDSGLEALWDLGILAIPIHCIPSRGQYILIGGNQHKGLALDSKVNVCFLLTNAIYNFIWSLNCHRRWWRLAVPIVSKQNGASLWSTGASTHLTWKRQKCNRATYLVCLKVFRPWKLLWCLKSDEQWLLSVANDCFKINESWSYPL